MRTNYFGIVLDESGSMNGIRSAVVKQMNEIAKTIDERSKIEGQASFVTMATIGSRYRAVHERYHRADPKVVQNFSYRDYEPYGQTPLFDGIELVMVRLAEIEQEVLAKGEDAAFCVIVITDGQENASHVTAQFLKNKMGEKIATDRWTFGFQLPPGAKGHFCSRFGFNEGACIEWESTEYGVQQATNQTQSAVSSYMTGRGMGVNSTRTFYAPNAGSLTKTEVAKTLTEIQSDKVKLWTVDKEIDVTSFIEEKGHKLTLGALYYKLTKKEKVQAYKEIVLQPLKEKKYFVGKNEARTMLGLPCGGDIMIEPGNSGNFNIYVQSTSVNRKLVRGTEVLYRLDMVKPIQETWDSAKAHEDAVKKQEAIAVDATKDPEIRIFGAIFAGKNKLADILAITGFTRNKADHVLRKLKQQGIVEFQGAAKDKGWKVVKGKKPKTSA